MITQNLSSSPKRWKHYRQRNSVKRNIAGYESPDICSVDCLSAGELAFQWGTMSFLGFEAV